MVIFMGLPGCRVPRDESHWYKGNLHAHTLWSDGDMLPEELVDWYAAHNYQFLGLSEHNAIANHESWILANDARQLARGAPACWISGTCSPTSRTLNGAEQWRLRTLVELRHKFERAGRFLLLQNEEVTNDTVSYRVHLTAVNISEVIAPVSVGDQVSIIEEVSHRVAALSERQGTRAIGIINHPNFAWSLSAENLAAVKSTQFVEIFNGHPSAASRGDSGKSSAVRLWDMANAERILELGRAPLFGVAADDTHARSGISEASPGRGWIVVRAAHLRANELIDAMTRGDFYASTGVYLNRCDFDMRLRSLLIAIAPEAGVKYQVEFIATKLSARPSQAGRGADRWDAPGVGVVVQRTTALQAQYKLADDDAYVRATVTASSLPENPIRSAYAGDETQFQQAFTQPVGWQRSTQLYR